MRVIQAIVEIDDEKEYEQVLTDFIYSDAEFETVDKYFMSHPVISKYPKNLREILWTCFNPVGLTNNDLIGVKDIPSLLEIVAEHIIERKRNSYVEDFIHMPNFTEISEMKRAEMIIKGERDQLLDYTIPALFPGGIKDKEVIQYFYRNGDEYIKGYLNSILT